MSGLSDERSFAALDQALATLTSLSVTDLAIPVPSCPGWTVVDLVDHTGRIHAWATGLLTVAPGERFAFPRGAGPTGQALLDHNRVVAAALVAALRARDLDTEVHTWFGPQPARWWLRRQVHENAVHAWDLRGALGVPTPLDADVAVDGVDEVLDVFLPGRFPAESFAGHGESLHLHATDVEGEWMLRFEPDRVDVSRGHGTGDVAARGPASELLLFLWGRTTPDALEVFGDATILERYQRTAAF